jgi:hypothetical protein
MTQPITFANQGLREDEKKWKIGLSSAFRRCTFLSRACRRRRSIADSDCRDLGQEGPC